MTSYPQLDPIFEQIARRYQLTWENGLENPWARIDNEHLIACHLPFGSLDEYEPDRGAAAMGVPFMSLLQGFAVDNHYRALVINRDGRHFLALRYLANGPNSFLAALAEAPYELWPLNAATYDRTLALFWACVSQHRIVSERLVIHGGLKLPDGVDIHPWPCHVQILADVNGRLRTQVFHTATNWIPDGRYYALDEEDRLHDIDWRVNDKRMRRQG